MNNNSKVLALKYRPQIFDDLIGQEVVAETIINSIKTDKVPNAYLFTGIRGIGKTTTARIVAKALNCSNGIETNVNLHAEGSVLVKFGNTHVICTASIDNNVPRWMKGTDKGWVTAEYGMLPRSTNERMGREAARGKQSGRTQEIQRRYQQEWNT